MGFTLFNLKAIIRRMATSFKPIAQSLLLEAFDASDNAICFFDYNWNYLYVNDQAAKFARKTKEQLIGKNLWEVIEQNTNSKVYEQYKSAVKSRQKTKITYFSEYTQQWYEATIYPLKNGIFITIKDITKSILIDKERLKNENLFKSVFIKAPIARSITDIRGNYIYINDAYTKLFGYSKEEILTMHPTQLMYPDEVAKNIQSVGKLTKDKDDFVQEERRYIHKDGHIIYGLAHISLIRDEKKNPLYLSVAIEDITKQKELEKQKDYFMAMISHELKTPLTSMKFFTTLVERTIKKGNLKESIKNIKKIDKNLDKLNILIKEMLDITKMQQGKYIVKREKFLIDDVIKSCLLDLQPIINHKIIFKDHNKEKVFADKERIRQVLFNLINNAVKYSSSTENIIITVGQNKKFVIVGVEDFGMGVAKEEREKIFQQFYQAEIHKTFSGLGLGLYISSEIIKANKGKLWVESTEGKGSIFYFSLPKAI